MDNLLNYRKSVYSKIGNDGIIEYIFKKLDIKKGIFVEFGAWDGIKNSNCRNLFNKRWDGIFIEPRKKRYNRLKENYKSYNQIICINSKIGIKENLFDDIVDPYLNNKSIDFCSIDIDGKDLEVFKTFKRHLPKVICIEGGQMLHPYHKEVSKNIEKKNIQQSLQVINKVFIEKGYNVLCSYQDSFFIKKEYYSLFNISPNLLELYFNGLRAIPGRIPFIYETLKKVELKNKIIEFILNNSNYKKYRWKNRREWANEQKDLIIKLINEREKKEVEKRNNKS